MARQNTKHTLGVCNFNLGSFPTDLTMDGIVALPVAIDASIGREIGLFWIDRTKFIRELAAVRPFQLFLKTGLGRTDFGPLMWMVFYVPDPKDNHQAFGAMECHLNPCRDSQVSLWRQLSNQTHWHLILVEAGNKVADLFEFENCFSLAEAIDSMEETCRGLCVADFVRAKQQFSERNSVEDLLRLG